MKRCCECGGTGDMFLLQNKQETFSPQQRVENLEWFQKHKKWWQVIATLECSLCRGFGKEER